MTVTGWAIELARVDRPEGARAWFVRAVKTYEGDAHPPVEVLCGHWHRTRKAAARCLTTSKVFRLRRVERDRVDVATGRVPS